MSEQCPRYSEIDDNVKLEPADDRDAVTDRPTTLKPDTKTSNTDTAIDRVCEAANRIEAALITRNQELVQASEKAGQDATYWKCFAEDWQAEAESWKAKYEAEQQRGEDRKAIYAQKSKGLLLRIDNTEAEWRTRFEIVQGACDAAQAEMGNRDAERRAQFAYESDQLEAARTKTKSREEELKNLKFYQKNELEEWRTYSNLLITNIDLTEQDAKTRQQKLQAEIKEERASHMLEKSVMKNRDAEWRIWAEEASANLEVEKMARKRAEEFACYNCKRPHKDPIQREEASDRMPYEIVKERHNPELPKDPSVQQYLQIDPKKEIQPITRKWWNPWSGKRCKTKASSS